MHRRLPTLVTPFDPGRVENCSYELSMGPESRVTGTESSTKTIHDVGGQVVIPPGQFAQLLTEEAVEIPADALALISMKSKLKQRGLINVSGFHVDPGFKGRLLFSVYNAGPNTIVVSRGAATFLIWYAALDEPTTDLYEGARQNLATMSDDDVMVLQDEVWTPQTLAERVGDLHRADLDNRTRKLEESLVVAKILASIAVALTLGVLGQWIIRGLLEDDNALPADTPAAVDGQADLPEDGQEVPPITAGGSQGELEPSDP